MDTIVAAGAILPTRPNYEEFDAVAAGLENGYAGYAAAETNGSEVVEYEYGSANTGLADAGASATHARPTEAAAPAASHAGGAQASLCYQPAVSGSVDYSDCAAQVSSTPAMDTIVAPGAILPTSPDHKAFDAVTAGLGRGSSLAGGKQGAVVGQAGAPSHDYAEMDALRAVPTHETKPVRAGTTGQTSTYGPMDPKLAYAHKGQVEREKNLFGEDIRAQDASPAAASSATQRKTPMSAAGGGAPQQAGTLYSLNPGEDQGTAQAVRFAPESATADPVTLAQGNTASEVYAEADLSRDGAGNVVNEAVYDDMHQERIPGAPVDDAM